MLLVQGYDSGGTQSEDSRPMCSKVPNKPPRQHAYLANEVKRLVEKFECFDHLAILDDTLLSTVTK